VGDVADLYSLHKEALLKLEGFAGKKADNLLAAIQTSRTQTLTRLITALGIHGIGEVAAVELAKNYQDLDELAHANHDEIQQIEGFGPNMAEAIVDWFASQKNQAVLRKLKAAGVWPQRETAQSTIPQTLTGRKFVVTGSLLTFTRDEIKDYITEHGGKVSDSISSQTDYLVVGENPGSKVEKAAELEVKTISEEQLKQLAEKNS